MPASLKNYQKEVNKFSPKKKRSAIGKAHKDGRCKLHAHKQNRECMGVGCPVYDVKHPQGAPPTARRRRSPVNLRALSNHHRVLARFR